MTVQDVISGMIAHLRAYVPDTPVFPQNQNLEKRGARQYIQIICRLNPSYCGVGGDVRQEYVIILECFFHSDADQAVDQALEFDAYVQLIMDALQDRTALDELQQRQSLKLHKGITDIMDHPFAFNEPGQFEKIITVKGYKIR